MYLLDDAVEAGCYLSQILSSGWTAIICKSLYLCGCLVASYLAQPIELFHPRSRLHEPLDDLYLLYACTIYISSFDFEQQVQERSHLPQCPQEQMV